MYTIERKSVGKVHLEQKVEYSNYDQFLNDIPEGNNRFISTCRKYIGKKLKNKVITELRAELILDYSKVKGLKMLQKQVDSSLKKEKLVKIKWQKKIKTLVLRMQKNDAKIKASQALIDDAEINLSFFELKGDKFRIGAWKRFLKVRKDNYQKFIDKQAALKDLLEKYRERQEDEIASFQRSRLTLRQNLKKKATSLNAKPSSARYYYLILVGSS